MKLKNLRVIKGKYAMLICWLFFMLQGPTQATVPADEILLEEAFHLIGQQYGVFFNYDQEMVSDTRVIYKAGTYQNVEDALSQVFDQTDLKYQIFDKRYVAVYRETREGVESLRRMIDHFQTIVDRNDEKTTERPWVAPTPVLKRTVGHELIARKALIYSITGLVTDANGEPLIGVNIQVKGTNTGTSTDIDGNFILEDIDEQAVLVLSYIGYQTQEIAVAGRSHLNITMVPDSQLLDEVVVVGYGIQKKSNITGSISSIRSRDLENVPSGRIEQALQGRVSGVTIMQNSGQPGSSSTIRIRGITTFNNNEPLYVVDGVVVDPGAIGYLNQSDIASIEVLKDAASAAIYGTRAAGGVILITTKKGSQGKLQVQYNGYYGISQPENILSLLNATQYAVLRNESAVAAGNQPPFANVQSLGRGTDWQNAIFNYAAPRHSNELSISGGNAISTFYFSGGIQSQEGIVTSEISSHDKINFRLNSTHKINDLITFGQTLGYTNQKGVGLGNTNSEFGGPLSSAINLDPITPLVVTDVASQPNAVIYNNENIIRDPQGNPYGISPYVGQEMTNPLAYTHTRLGNYGWSDDIIGNAFVEITPIESLNFRSTVGIKKAYWGNVSYTPLYFLSNTVQTNSNNYNKGENRVFNWNLENSLTYTQSFGKHDFTVLLGQAAYVDNTGGNVGMTFFNLPIDDYRDASFNFDVGLANRDGYSGDFVQHKISSLFSRVNYSFDDKYLFTGIVRRDGSTRFGTNMKYGVFPSFSVGWNIHQEDFFNPASFISQLKIRGGYGVVGNDAMDDFRYLSLVVGGFNYSIGRDGAVTTGYAPETLDNPNLHWEETRSADIGFDMEIFQNFTVNFDWFNKKTVGILRPVVIPGYVGVSSLPWDNVADMENTGVELELGYNNSFGDFNISVNANGSFLKNVVTYVAADTNFIAGGASFQSMGNVTRIQEGQSYNSFFGYKTLGIFQNEEQIRNYTNGEGMIQPDARPGDFIWADLDGDGQITSGDLDKTFLGSSLPKYTFGMNLSMEYKGLDLMVFAQGVGGNKIFQGLRRLDILTSNYSTRAMSRWHGEGTSQDYPRLVDSDPNGNFTKMSDFYLEDGDYLRVKLLQLGYTLPQNLFGRLGLNRLRVYVTAENLLTLTRYTGFDPEVGGGVFGIDKGQYPQARTFLGGIQLSF